MSSPIFPSFPYNGIASENLSGSLSLFGGNKKGGKEASLVHAYECVRSHTHILNKVISVSDTIRLGPPEFRVECGSWDPRKSRLYRRNNDGKEWRPHPPGSGSPSPSSPCQAALHFHPCPSPSSSSLPGAVSSSSTHLRVTSYPKPPCGPLLPMLALDHQTYPCFHKSLHLDYIRKKERINRKGRKWEGWPKGQLGTVRKYSPSSWLGPDRIDRSWGAAYRIPLISS